MAARGWVGRGGRREGTQHVWHEQMRPTLTPTLSLSEERELFSVPSAPEGERDKG